MAELKSRTRLTAAFACGLALATAGGCRNLDNAQVDVLERELRQQEDYIYELEDYLISYSEKLRQCRMAANCPPTTAKPTPSASKKKTLPGEPQLMEDLPRPAPPAAREPAVDPSPATEATELESIDPKDLEVPELEFGPGASSLKWKTRGAVAAAPTPAQEHVADEGPLYIPDPVDYQADEQDAAAALAAADAPEAAPPEANPEVDGPVLQSPAAEPARLTAERLTIRRVFGEHAEDEPTKLDRLLVIVEALSSADEPVDASGETSIMVMARNEAGELERVERWDFTPEETAAAWQSSRLGDGLHLELPLDGRELPAGKLELWARLVGDDGGKLLASQPLEPTLLTSVQDALPEAPVLAGEPLPPAIPVAAEAPTTEAPAKRRSLDEPKWRASAERLDPDRVEGFASTAAGKPGWKTQSPLTQVQRVAAAAPTDGGKATPAKQPAERQWTPFR